VEIVNPAAAPVLTSSVNDPGWVAYQSTVNNVGKCSGASCSFFFPSVPALHRVVVQHIGGIVGFNSVPTQVSVLIAEGGFLSAFFAPIPTRGLSSVFDQPVLFYVDSMGSVSVEVFLLGGAVFTGDSVSQFVTLTGYELDCSAAPCAAIAQ